MKYIDIRQALIALGLFALVTVPLVAKADDDCGTQFNDVNTYFDIGAPSGGGPISAPVWDGTSAGGDNIVLTSTTTLVTYEVDYIPSGGGQTMGNFETQSGSTICYQYYHWNDVEGSGAFVDQS